MDYIGIQFHPSHSVYILVLSIFLVSSCDIILMCWEAIDDHLLWAYYSTCSFFFCLLFLLIWPCVIFLSSLLLTPHAFVSFPCLFTASGYGGDGMTCDALHLLAANKYTDMHRQFHTVTEHVVFYLWLTNSVWYIKGWVWQQYRPQFITNDT